jgi:hypothetical protein
MLKQEDVAKHLDMSDRQLRNVLARLGLNHKTDSLDRIRVAYIRDLRETASGRQASEQRLKLDVAKTREAEANAQFKELAVYREYQLILDKSQVMEAMSAWIALAKSEYTNSIEKILAMLESRHNLTIERSDIDGITDAAMRTIGDGDNG